MKKLPSLIFALLLLWSAGPVSPAQEHRPGGTQAVPRGAAKPGAPGAGKVDATPDAAASKPFVTVSFAGYNALRGQIEAVGKLAGNPGLGRGLEALITLLTQGKGLAGLDQTRPWGVVVPVGPQDRTFDQLGSAAYGFVPVTDLKRLAALVPDPKSGKPRAPGADGVWEIRLGPRNHYYAVQKGGWAFFADNRDALKHLPADPAPLLGDLPTRYTLACRVSMRALPPQLRNWMVSQTQMFWQMFQQGRFGGSDEDDETGVARMALFQWFLLKGPGLIRDLDEVFCGVALAPDGKSAYVDFRLTAVTGSATAQKFTRLKGTATALAGLGLPDAAVTAHWVHAMDDFDLSQASNSLAAFQAQAARRLDDSEDLTAEQAGVAKQMLADAVAVMQKTLQGRKIDCGLSWAIRPRASTLLCGGVIADGDKLDKVVKQLIAQICADDPDAAKSLKVDAEIFQGVHLHVASSGVASADFAPLLGKKIELALGIGADRVYLAAGSHALETLKEAILKSKAAAGKEVPPLRISVSGTPIAQFAAATLTGPDKLKAAKIAGLLKKTPAGDHATLTVTPIPRGVSARLEIEEGLLKVLGNVLPALLVPDAGAALRGSLPLGGPPAGEKPEEPDPFDTDQ
jgi:hypothetical protein